MADPITSSLDLWPLVPEHMRNENQPVLDDAIESLAAICMEYQSEGTAAAKQVDLGDAEDQFLTGLAADHEVYRQTGESNAALQYRAVQAPKCVSRDALTQIVDPIVRAYAPLRVVHCRILDAVLDRAYIPGDTSVLRSYVATDQTWEASPDYSERYYSRSAVTSGLEYRSCSMPVGMHIFQDGVGRQLLILIPEPDDTSKRMEMLTQVVNAVTAAIGQGVRWSVWISQAIY